VYFSWSSMLSDFKKVLTQGSDFLTQKLWSYAIHLGMPTDPIFAAVSFHKLFNACKIDLCVVSAVN